MKKIIIIAFLMLTSAVSFSQESVNIPNVFSPNQDGVNDFFQIRSTGYSTLKCSIFDRYGGLVYQFYGLNGNWDGYTHAGMECVEGTYFLIVELGIEGGETQSFQSDLQLAR